MPDTPSTVSATSGRTPPGDPTVSVVIPTFNRIDRLRRTLDGLSKQSVPAERFETIVVSDGSTDDTAAYLRSDRPPLPVRFFEQPNQGPAAARNRGVAEARGELLLFIDDDVIPGPDLVRRHLDARADDPSSRVVVIGPLLDPPDHEMVAWVRWEQRTLYKQYDAMRRGDFEPHPRQFYTGNASVPRDAVMAVGGFDTSFRRAEDVELAFRLEDAGLDFRFDHEAESFHYAHRSYDAWRSNAYEYGRNDVVFGRDLGRSSLLGMVGEMYGRRHVLSRLLTSWSVPRPRVRQLADAALRALAAIGDRLSVEQATQFALSAIYNIEYYRGVADEIGDPDVYQLLLDDPPAAIERLVGDSETAPPPTDTDRAER